MFESGLYNDTKAFSRSCFVEWSVAGCLKSISKMSWVLSMAVEIAFDARRRVAAYMDKIFAARTYLVKDATVS